MALPLNSSEEEVINRQVQVDNDIIEESADWNVEEVFEVDRCVDWIKAGEYKNVVLQFPDSLLRFAATVAVAIQKETGNRAAILGDTSFGECCVDEVAAEHVGADSLIHFGNACLTETRRLPVLYIFTTLRLNVEALSNALKEHNEAKTRIVLFYDVRYHKAINESKDLFDENVHLCFPKTEVEKNPEEPVKEKFGRIIPSNIKEDDQIIFVGKSDKFPMILRLNFTKHQLFVYNPKTDKMEGLKETMQKILMKRFYLLERIKDAKRIGILVGTLGVARYRDVIDRMSKEIKASGRKRYTFSLGKPNPAKLANFPEIDVFVMIACPENSYMDDKEYLRPIVTPFEIDLALNKGREWTGDFTTDFHDILPEGEKFIEFEKKSNDNDVSLVTGKVRSLEMGEKKSENDQSEGALIEQERAVSLLHREGAGEFLAQRSWKGLEMKLGETPATKAEPGQKGIACHYEGEGEI